MKNQSSHQEVNQLDKFIEHLQEISTMMPTQIIGVKNLDSRYIYCSSNYARLFGLSVSEIVGKYGMFAATSDDKLRIQEDQQIITSQKPLAFLHIDKVNGNLIPFTFIKSPIINPLSNQVIGIICQAFEFATINPGQKLVEAFNELSITDKQESRPKLTKREKQVIFLFLANLSSQEITEVLYKLEGKKISKSTIDGLFTEQLFVKFGVYNRQALYTRLCELGYNRLIPAEMFNQQTFSLDTQSIY